MNPNHILRSDVCGSRPLVVSDFGGFWSLLGNDVVGSNHYSVGTLTCLGRYYELTLVGPDYILGSDVIGVWPFIGSNVAVFRLLLGNDIGESLPLLGCDVDGSRPLL